MFAAESFSRNRRGSFVYVDHQTNEDIYGKTVTVLWYITIYAFSRFVELQCSNMHSWSSLLSAGFKVIP